MELSKVTMTGADNGTNPRELILIAKQFPFVEWGILICDAEVSSLDEGRKRFPSLDWIGRLKDAVDKDGFFQSGMNLSLHLCGDYVTDFLKGNFDFKGRLGPLFEMFQRIQINTHGVPHEWCAQPIHDFISAHPEKEFIFQYDNVNTDLFEVLAGGRGSSVMEGLKNISALFDLSHGAGVLPEEWPRPLSFAKCGYAGGLSPQNIRHQLSVLKDVAKGHSVWIDMETHVRSNNDLLFDLGKVQSVLEICEDEAGRFNS